MNCISCAIMDRFPSYCSRTHRARIARSNLRYCEFLSRAPKILPAEDHLLYPIVPHRRRRQTSDAEGQWQSHDVVCWKMRPWLQEYRWTAASIRRACESNFNDVSLISNVSRVFRSRIERIGNSYSIFFYKIIQKRNMDKYKSTLNINPCVTLSCITFPQLIARNGCKSILRVCACVRACVCAYADSP